LFVCPIDVLEAWLESAGQNVNSGSRESAIAATDKAEQLLLRMIQHAIATNTKAYLSDRRIVSRVLELWTQCRLPLRAESFFRTIQELHEKTKFQQLKPKASEFLRVMNAWASEGNDSSGNAAQHAENLLQEMQSRFMGGDLEMKPTALHSTVVISAWARSERHDLVAKCRAVFDDVANTYNKGDDEARPDTALYGAVFKAYSRVGDGEGAVVFLQGMLRDFLELGNGRAKPTTGIFNMVFLSLLRSDNPEAPERSLGVFQMMQTLNAKERLGVYPDLRTYSLVIETLSNARSTEMEEKKRYFVEQLSHLRKRNGP
jgi:hypothetical protein